MGFFLEADPGKDLCPNNLLNWAQGLGYCNVLNALSVCAYMYFQKGDAGKERGEVKEVAVMRSPELVYYPSGTHKRMKLRDNQFSHLPFLVLRCGDGRVFTFLH